MKWWGNHAFYIFLSFSIRAAKTSPCQISFSRLSIFKKKRSKVEDQSLNSDEDADPGLEARKGTWANNKGKYFGKPNLDQWFQARKER